MLLCRGQSVCLTVGSHMTWEHPSLQTHNTEKTHTRPQAGVLPQTSHDESIKYTADSVLSRAVISIQTVCADL